MKTNARSSHSAIETLESRIAPATFTLHDVNNDIVRFTSSSSAFVSTDVTTPLGAVDNHDAFVVNLTGLTGPHNVPATLTVSVTKAGGGDGQVYVGIVAPGTDLGAINIVGDLGLLTAGTGSSTVPAIKSLTVSSIGRFPSLPNADSLVTSNITGSITRLVVRGNVDGTYLDVSQNIGSISIGGSVIGGDFAHDGEIAALGNIGRISVAHDVRGGEGKDSGEIAAVGNFTTATIGGSIFGGYGEFSGSVGPGLGATSIAVAGSVYGGFGQESGSIFGGYNTPGGTIGKVTIGGSLVGGSGLNSGEIGSGDAAAPPDLTLTDVVINGDIIGGNGQYSGSVIALGGSIGRLTLRGSVFGGEGSNSGFISANTASGTISIAGSIFGGVGGSSGNLVCSAGFQTVTLGGSLVGGYGPDSGGIFANAGEIGHLKISGDVVGSVGVDSGDILDTGGATPVILGEVFAGSGAGSGSITT
jgi:hypothetical protein